MDHRAYAEELFVKGYNCAQAITVAFSDVTGIPAEQSAKMAASFGGGMGRMREVCGAVSGVLMVLGMLSDYDHPDDSIKREHYVLVQKLAGEYRSQVGSIVCREILKNPPSDPNPTPRTPEFYKTRPCARLVGIAAGILDEYLQAGAEKD